MQKVLRFTAEPIHPTRDAVLENLGVPHGAPLADAVEARLRQALELAAELAEPVALLSEIGPAEFAALFAGEGRNEPTSPIAQIHARAERRALFVATLGTRVADEITRAFTAHEPTLGAMLDAVASAQADRLGTLTADGFHDLLSDAGQAHPGTAAQCYSPGYCGWHISGQRKLFDFLRPEQIGVTLNSSFLMQPLKSVSGVILVGPAEMHVFDDTYPFCATCRTHACRARIDTVLRRAAAQR